MPRICYIAWLSPILERVCMGHEDLRKSVRNRILILLDLKLVFPGLLAWGSEWPEAKNFKSISWGGGSMLLVELLRLCLVSASVPGAAPETWKERRIQSHRKPQTGPLIECMRNGRTFISVGELKVKGQKDEQELVIQEALASQLDLWKKNSDCWISEEIDSYSFSMRKMLWLGKVRSLLRWAFSSRKKRN